MFVLRFVLFLIFEFYININCLFGFLKVLQFFISPNNYVVLAIPVSTILVTWTFSSVFIMFNLLLMAMTLSVVATGSGCCCGRCRSHFLVDYVNFDY